MLMFNLTTIIALNNKQGRKAKRHSHKPLIATCDKDKTILKCPNLGSYRPKGWELIDQFFVDKTGLGSDWEPALTVRQFIDKVKAGLGYAIIEEGECQLYIGVFEQIC